MNNYNRINPITDFVDQILNKSVSEVVKKDFTNTNPNVNIIKHAEHYLLQLAAVGLKKEDFTLELNNDNLIIAVNKNNTSTDTAYSRKEFDFSNFKRSFTLPQNVDKSNIKAKYKSGILEIKIMKSTNKEEEHISIEIS